MKETGKVFGVLQRVGRAFMLPIAVLPVAGLLLGIGRSLTNETMLRAYHLMKIMGPGTVLYGVIKVGSDCGSIIFGNLPLIFAMGVSIGMAKAEKAVAALSGALSFFVMHEAISSMLSLYGDTYTMHAGATDQILGITSLQLGVFGGILVGLGVGYLHNRFYKIKLPEVLSFFGGTRAVPVICTIVYVGVGILMFFIWPPIQNLMYSIGGIVRASGYLGTFIYGVMERALIPFGLHHVFYLPFWQTSLGGTMEVAGKMIDGAQNIFFAQLADPATTHFNCGSNKIYGRKISVDDLWIARSGICNLPLCQTRTKKSCRWTYDFSSININAHRNYGTVGIYIFIYCTWIIWNTLCFCRTCIYDDACIEDYSWINIFWRAYRSVLFWNHARTRKNKLDDGHSTGNCLFHSVLFLIPFSDLEI